MKGIILNSSYYFKFFIIILLLFFLSSCNVITPTAPIIHSFTADDTTIDEGESVSLSWTVTDASTVTINPGGLTVALSGSTSVSPTETTTYILTATNSAGTSSASISIVVNPIVIIEQTMTLPLGPLNGQDSYVFKASPDTILILPN